ncbi:MAG: dynamin family protein [Ancrocorticia sp.]|uniref:dynamin family protein n=1 Tax=Ancrocorticia sp. TaxID=2593684 RepID=UPI003F90E983
MMLTVRESDPVKELEALHAVLEGLQFPLTAPHRERGREARDDIVHQLEDYIIPRYEALEAPLLGVVGGSTGSGKSMLVNSLVREGVAESGAIRPTTRRPLLVHSPTEGPWFNDTRILPHLTRVRGGSSHPDANNAGLINELQVRAASGVPAGVALLDSPDIDSVVEENRRLAGQLLQAADLWIFVTTAARYGDAIPWALLDEAAARDIVVAVVLNRVPPGIGSQIRPDLSERLVAHGLGAAPLFMISESLDDSGLIPEQDVEPVRTWLAGLASDRTARASVARQTLEGAVRALFDQRSIIGSSLVEQSDAYSRMERELAESFAQASQAMDSLVADGAVLRGEVLHRWQEVVGTGEWMRKLESGVASLRDRISAWFSGGTPSGERVEEAVQDSLVTLLVSEAEQAISRLEAQWIDRPESTNVLTAAEMTVRSSEERTEAAQELVHHWHQSLTEAIGSTGKDKKATARILSVGVNVVGAALMIVIFASTAGLTGGEVAVAGGTALVAQRLLEAVFGEDAVRRMAARARSDLEQAVTEFFAAEARPFEECLSVLGVDEDAPARFEAAYADVEKACGRRLR